jgi:cytochrome c-type protein NapC
MITPFVLLMLLIALTVVLLVMLVVRPSITQSRAGKVLAFLAIFLLPLMAGSGGAAAHMEKSKETKFCLSCHVMEDYGKSLHVDDPNYLAANHYLNHRVPADSACYTCHTDYGMYGDVKSKFRGLRHVYIQYFSTPPNPIKLYSPYNNRECLHCHEGARSFEEGAIHNADPDTLPQIKANKLSCMSSGCHDTVHNVSHLKEVKFWPAK